MDPSKMLRARNNGKVEWNTTRCILPVAHYPLHTAEYATVILASDWLYFSRHGIKNGTACERKGAKLIRRTVLFVEQ